VGRALDGKKATNQESPRSLALWVTNCGSSSKKNAKKVLGEVRFEFSIRVAKKGRATQAPLTIPVFTNTNATTEKKDSKIKSSK